MALLQPTVVFFLLTQGLFALPGEPIQPRNAFNGGGVIESKNSPLQAPFLCLTHNADLVEIDLGRKPVHPSEITLLDLNEGIIFGQFIKTEKRSVRPCPDSTAKIPYFVGIYKANHVSNPFIAFAGHQELSILERAPVELLSEACNLSDALFSNNFAFSGFSCNKISSHLDLQHNHKPVLRVAENGIQMLLKLTLQEKPYYIVRVALPEIGTAIGVLHQHSNDWVFLYRTTDPPERVVICD